MLRKAAALAVVGVAMALSTPSGAEAGQLVEKMRDIAAKAKAKVAQKLAEGARGAVNMAVVMSQCAVADEDDERSADACRSKTKASAK